MTTNNPQTSTIDRIAEIERILEDPEVLTNREYADFKANALEDMKILVSELRRLRAEREQVEEFIKQESNLASDLRSSTIASDNLRGEGVDIAVRHLALIFGLPEPPKE